MGEMTGCGSLSHARHGEHRARRFRHNSEPCAFRFNAFASATGFGGCGGQLERYIPTDDGFTVAAGGLAVVGLVGAVGGRPRLVGFTRVRRAGFGALRPSARRDGAHRVNRWLHRKRRLDNGFRHRLGGRFSAWPPSTGFGATFIWLTLSASEREEWLAPIPNGMSGEWYCFGCCCSGCSPGTRPTRVRHVRHCPLPPGSVDDWPSSSAAFCCVWLVIHWPRRSRIKDHPTASCLVVGMSSLSPAHLFE